ncbi:glutamate receptor-like [Haliotis rubra]|uniref:glutamate receptor-like n=1 Tax=Haliotis rubra TaxID=36100 RepID=UPI001EE58555|nr:glutamate receptor-like [Haliotis rubra]
MHTPGMYMYSAFLLSIPCAFIDVLGFTCEEEQRHNAYGDNVEAVSLANQLLTESSISHLIAVTSDYLLASTEPFFKNKRDIHIVFSTTDTYMATTEAVVHPLLKRQSIDAFWKYLNFLVVCSCDCINKLMIQTHQLDVDVGKGVLLRHFSRWVIIPTDNHTCCLSTREVVFDNINMISKKNWSSRGMSQRMKVFSLLWEPHGRKWGIVESSSYLKAFPNTNYGLNGRTLRVAALEWLPYAKREVIDGEIVYTGVSMEILKQLSVTYNFSVNIVEPEDRQWGEKNHTSWNGIVGMLQREEVDMTSVPYAASTERTDVMTYSYPIIYSTQSGVYKKTEDKMKHWAVLTSCFKWEVYLCGLMTLFGVVILFLILEKVNPRQDELKHGMGVSDIAFLGILIPLHQGIAVTPYSSSSKVLLGFWWCFCVIITSVYTGNLIAFLTITKEYVPFSTLEEVSQQDEYVVGVGRGSYVELMLKTSNSSTLQKLWQMSRHSKMPENLSADEEWQHLLSNLFAGHYVLLLSGPSTARLMAERCDISQLHQHFLPAHSSIAFPRLSPLSQLFAKEIMYMTESGLISKWNSAFSPKARPCMDASRDTPLQFKSGDFLSAFVASAAGITFASVILMFERLMECFRKRD